MTEHAMPFGAATTHAAQELPARLGKFAANPRLIVTLACLLLLVPFLSKPLHIDDPMYVWAAEHILAQPLDPYGFAVNWGSTLEPMPDAMKNPPLVCYYLAGAMMLLGRSEQALHLAMLLPAVGVILGTYQLAKALGSRPVMAAASTLATPVFLLSATTVMSDVAMVCAYVWAVWWRAAGGGGGGGPAWPGFLSWGCRGVSAVSAVSPGASGCFGGGWGAPGRTRRPSRGSPPLGPGFGSS